MITMGNIIKKLLGCYIVIISNDQDSDFDDVSENKIILNKKKGYKWVYFH